LFDSNGVLDVATTVTWVLTREPDADRDGQPDATDPCPTDFNNQCDTSASPTSLAVTSATGDFADSTTVSAILTSGGARVSNKSVTLTLNQTQTCSVTTDASGTASCDLTPGEPAGIYPLDASFAGDNAMLASNGAGTFVVTLEETALDYTGATAAVNGMPFTMTGTLTTDDPAAGTDLDGRQVTFTLGTGGTAQSCTANTAGGSAGCTITSVNQAAGPAPLSASFAGDTFYQPATATSRATVFVAPATGAFVIGHLSATSGKPVNFWGAQWSAANKLTGGSAPASFKGFANNPTALTCGSTWTTGTGSSSNPPAAIPGVINVIVSDQVVQKGSTISGTIRHIVQVHVRPGYGPDPGRPGLGTVVGTVC
jgi:hypothetical protein